MLKYYCWNTQNSRKAALFFVEAKLNYEIIPVDLFNNEHKQEAFLKINPNGRIPALVDETGGKVEDVRKSVTIFESGCILQYLAEITGKYLPQDLAEKYEVLSWLNWQMSGLGPTLGQLAHFSVSAAPDSKHFNSLLKSHAAKELHHYSLGRFYDESMRLLLVLEGQLETHKYICGKYSIADMAVFPWVESIWGGMQASNPQLDETFSNISRWLTTMLERPSVQQVLKDYAWEMDFKAHAQAHNAALFENSINQ
jgi:GST-like protein